MKIRKGFVSNSSSTSFCIYGVYLDNYDDDEMEKLEKAAIDIGLYYHYGQDNDIYIGREWFSIGDDETGRQFKMNVEEKIDKLDIDNKDCSTYDESWYDG